MIATLLLSLGVTFGPEQAVPQTGTQSQHRVSGTLHAWTGGNKVWLWDEQGAPELVSDPAYKSDHPAITAGGWVAWHTRYSGLGNSAPWGMVVLVRTPSGSVSVATDTTETAFDPVLVEMPDDTCWVAFTAGAGMYVRASHAAPDGSWLARDVLLSPVSGSHHPTAGLSRGKPVVLWEQHNGPTWPNVVGREINGPAFLVGGTGAYFPSASVHRRGFLGVAWRESDGEVRSAITLPTAKPLSTGTLEGYGGSVKVAWVGDELVPAIEGGGTITVGSESWPADGLGSWDGESVGYSRSGRAYWRRVLP